jgi:hypothetical protein
MARVTKKRLLGSKDEDGDTITHIYRQSRLDKYYWSAESKKCGAGLFYAFDGKDGVQWCWVGGLMHPDDADAVDVATDHALEELRIMKAEAMKEFERYG